MFLASHFIANSIRHECIHVPVYFSTCVEKEMKLIPSYSIAEAFFCEKTKQKHNSIDVCLEFVLHSNLKLVKGAVGNT